ncbi:uncharacterized protein DUF1599 [Thermoflavifilum aggregans]|uniref:Uncharacterized protein DUF1599 n=1 Tax=Thermoflavifilum aggregans TaxID=454188 RepID=A0A2M9CUD4_9BACT|nr:DUF1599 domain-containing protein [Thermoflavifilum aggregans]MBX6380038.1 DUF1599 domain-containing protein [Thermoflavifilum aggregans]PJJ75524.1 uncharacterized protein DUF1599 [Thermoflavifilum aggregans]
MSEQMHTSRQYDQVIAECRKVYLEKIQQYGTSWRVLRTISIADQIYIKAYRIRTIQEKQLQLVPESVVQEWIAMVNYGIIALIQFKLKNDERIDLPAEEALAYYDAAVSETKDLMLKKNHDYGEAWREMSLESLVDLILTKLLRIRQMVRNPQTDAEEQMYSNFQDIINYAVFALIKQREEHET